MARLFLVFYVPSKVNLVSGKQAIETSQKEGNLIASPVLFNDSIALQALSHEPIEDGQFKLSFLWKNTSDIDLKYKVAVHFLNNKGQIVGQLDFVESANSYPLKKGHYWRDDVIIPVFRTLGMKKSPLFYLSITLAKWKIYLRLREQ